MLFLRGIQLDLEFSMHQIILSCVNLIAMSCSCTPDSALRGAARSLIHSAQVRHIHLSIYLLLQCASTTTVRKFGIFT